MKKILSLMTVLLLLVALVGCGQAQNGPDTSGDSANSSSDQWEDPTPWPAPIIGETEAPDPNPESTETEPSKELTLEEKETMADAYEWAPDELRLFVFRGEQPEKLQDLDISGLEIGYLYVYNEETEDICATGVCGIDRLVVTQDYFYYTVTDDPTRLLRMDYTGGEQTVIYETDQKITYIDYYGIDANGDLAVVLDEQQVVLHHIATGETEFIMEQYFIESVMYYGTSFYYRTPDVGPTLHWRGQPTAEDDGGIDFYAYYIELDEMEVFDFPDD